MHTLFLRQPEQEGPSSSLLQTEYLPRLNHSCVFKQTFRILASYHLLQYKKKSSMNKLHGNISVKCICKFVFTAIRTTFKNFFVSVVINIISYVKVIATTVNDNTTPHCICFIHVPIFNRQQQFPEQHVCVN